MWDAQTMTGLVVGSLRRVCRSLVIVGADRDFPVPQGEGIRPVPDVHPHPGPLSGLQALFSSHLDTGYLVAASDQPFLTVHLLRQLINGNPSLPHLFLAPKGISFHPFPGYYPASLLDVARRTLRSENHSMREFLRHCSPLWVPISEYEENHLLCVNPPAQLDKLRKIVGHNTVAY